MNALQSIQKFPQNSNALDLIRQHDEWVMECTRRLDGGKLTKKAVKNHDKTAALLFEALEHRKPTDDEKKSLAWGQDFMD